MARDRFTDGKIFTAVCYPENMVDNWEVEIYHLIQHPFAYCIHDKDLCREQKEERKKHLHLIVVFNNTTTLNHAFNVINKLSKEGHCCIPNNRIERVEDIVYMYNYLIHNTEDCRKKHKHLYDKTERILGNNFDIGLLEQVSLAEKKRLVSELSHFIIEQGICNYTDFYISATEKFFDSDDLGIIESVISSYSSHFERLTRGNWQKLVHNKL